MESTQNQVQVSEVEKYKLRIKTYGEHVNSPKPENRYFELNIDYSTPKILRDIEGLVDTYNDLVKMWARAYYEEFAWNHNFVVSAGSGSWWIYYKQCKFCREIYDKMMAQWRSGKIVARDMIRTYCLRHYLIKHLEDLDIVDNKPREFTLTAEEINAKLSTNRYDYAIAINREKAIMRVIDLAKEKTYVFTYNNHTNAFPYTSSYDALIDNVLELIRGYIVEALKIVYQNAEYNGVLILNGQKYETVAKA
jgi:hypothetical protein